MKLLKLHFTVVLLLSSFSSLAQSGQSVYDESIVHEIRVTFNQASYWDSLTQYYDDYLNNGAEKRYLLATNVSIDGVDIDSVGVRQKGFFSNWGAFGSNKKPLKLDFKEFKDHKFDGLKKINLANGFKDPSMMRDVMAYKVFREMGLKAPRTAYAKVYLNDQYWGLYIMVEQIDSEFLEDHYGQPDGNLYKCIDNTSLKYQGNNWSSYSDEFALKTNEDINDNSRFIDLVKKINQTPDAQFKDSLDAIFETSDYLAILACDVLMYNWDSYYEHGRNFYMYLNPHDNKFEWIPWDYNLAFSESATNIILSYNDPQDEKPLVKRTQENQEYRQWYFQRICHILLNRFNLSYLEEYIDNTAELIRPDLLADQNKFYTIANFDDNVDSDVTIPGTIWQPTEVFPGIKSFISGRMNTVMNQLSGHGFSCVLEVPDHSDATDWLVYPNPLLDGTLTVDFKANVDNATIEVWSVAGQKVYEATSSKSKVELDLSSLQRGVYIVKALKGNQLMTKKIVRK